MHQITPHRAVPRTLDLPSGPVAVLEAPGDAGAPKRGTAVLVPGYTGSKEDFAPVFEGLTGDGFRVVALDLPGQHESPGPVHRSAYATDVLGEVVLEAIGLLSSEPTHLVGHSFGGLVSRAAAISAPQRLLSLTLLCSGPSAITGNRLQRMELLEPILAAGGMPALLAAIEELDRLDPRSALQTPELKAFLGRRFLASSPYGMQGMGAALRAEPDRVPELAATGLPMLVAWGEDDDAWDPAAQAEMAARLGARQQVIAGAAHSPAVEQPARTVTLLSEFWAEVETSPAA